MVRACSYATSASSGPPGTGCGRPTEDSLDAKIGEASVTGNGESVTTLVVIGEDDAPNLLDAYTLEGLALVLGPVHAPEHLAA